MNASVSDQPHPIAVRSITATLCLIMSAGCSSADPDQNGGAPRNSDPNSETGSSAGVVPAPALSGVIPTKVANLPDSGSAEAARPFFDTFSWQSFIALNWPAAPGVRGVAFKPNDASVMRSPPKGPRVWDTYKDADDLFAQGNAGPTPWDSFTNPVNICEPKSVGERIFSMVTKAGSVLDETNESFSVPLVDQNKNFAHFEIKYNKAMYDRIVSTEWYLMRNLARAQPVNMPPAKPGLDGGKPVFPPGAPNGIMLKGAWRELIAGKDDFDRYYWIEAKVYDAATKSCSTKTVGLVGLHIAQKTARFPQWIWSSFEHVDNVRRQPGVPDSVPLSFNNGTDTPPTPSGWANRPDYSSPKLPPKEKRVPVQVSRLNPIPTTPAGNSTVELNQRWQKFLEGTVWQYYELVITQWPSDPGTFVYKGDGGTYPKYCGGAFPEQDCVNTTMETYFQSRTDATGAGGNSCMKCHYTADECDFSWSLQLRAYAKSR